jgi:hypothetical protein
MQTIGRGLSTLLDEWVVPLCAGFEEQRGFLKRELVAFLFWITEIIHK